MGTTQSANEVKIINISPSTSPRGRFFFLLERLFCDKMLSKHMKKTPIITKKMRDRSVAQSSKMEGLSLTRAKKDKALIKKLKTYGRAFSI